MIKSEMFSHVDAYLAYLNPEVPVTDKLAEVIARLVYLDRMGAIVESNPTNVSNRKTEEVEAVVDRDEGITQEATAAAESEVEAQA